MPKKRGDAQKINVIIDYMKNNQEGNWREIYNLIDDSPIQVLHRGRYSFREIAKILKCSKGTISNQISDGQREKTKARNLKNKEIFDKELLTYKETSGCNRCHKEFPYYALEFDHFKGEKIASVSRLKRTKGKKITVQEIKEKCQVLCIYCHRLTSLERKLNGKFDEYVISHKALKEEVNKIIDLFIKGEEIPSNVNMRKNNIAYVKNLKEETPCKDCNELFPFYQLDFDHINPENKLGDISAIQNNGNTRALLDEIAKCEIVCALCHAKRSDQRRIKKYKKY